MLLPLRLMRLNEIGRLMATELALDMRQKQAIGGMLLYVVSAIYVCYLAFKQVIGLDLWNALFWLIMLFAAFNTLARSFQREDPGRQLYLHTLADPRSVILARTFYGMGVMAVLSIISAVVFTWLLGTRPLGDADALQFLAVLVLGSCGLAAVLTFIAALASRAGGNFGIMAVLGFPVVLPVLLVLMRASRNALDGLAWSIGGKYLLWLGILNVLTLALAYLLFPYLWRD